MTTAAPAAPNLDRLYGPIAADIEKAASIFDAELKSDQPVVNDLCRHIGQYHGKMLRPAMVLLAGRACGEIRQSHHVVAAVVEMVHVATLVHDDILDDADTRRRVSTVNRLHGNERAVLLGDYLISHAFHLCSSLASQHASRRIGATTNEVCEGELMQVANRGNFELDEPAYLEIIRRKTAALISVSCELGAWCGEAPPAVLRGLAGYGMSLGVAFQIIDDLLDLTGDEKTVGKSLGRDVEKSKLTLPLIHYLANCRPAERREMLDLLQSASAARDRKIAATLRNSASLAYAREVAERYVAEARSAVESLAPSAARDTLVRLAEFVIAREK